MSRRKIKRQRRDPDAERFAEIVTRKLYDSLDSAPDGGVIATFTPEMIHEAMWEMGDCSICGTRHCPQHSLELQKMRFAAERESLGAPLRLHIKAPGAPNV